MNMLAAASALSDEDLLAHIDVLASRERLATAELVAHLAALRARPSLYAAKGYGSLFSYCTEALHLSEDAACNRIEAAKACERFPVILDFLAAGTLTLTSVRLLGRHLTKENHQAVLEKAKGRTRHQVDALIAELAPRPDVPTSVRKVPTPSAPPPTPPVATTEKTLDGPTRDDAPPDLPVLRPTSRPVVQISAPQRYRVQFTIGEESHDRLRRVQALLRREIPDGDPAAIFDRALVLLLAQVEKTKLGVGVTARPSARRPIRSGTDKPRTPATRYTPSWVKPVVWRRDDGQCAFTSSDGRRCTERTFLEFHHVHPHAKGGPASVANISLRCRRHNQCEAELVFGPRATARFREDGGATTHTVGPGSQNLVGWSMRTPPPGRWKRG